LFIFQKKQQVIVDLAQHNAEVFVAINTKGTPVLKPFLGQIIRENMAGNRTYYQPNQEPTQPTNEPQQRYAQVRLDHGVFLENLNTSLHFNGEMTYIIDYEKERFYQINPMINQEVRRLNSKYQRQAEEENPKLVHGDESLELSAPIILGYTDDRAYLWTARILPYYQLMFTCVEEIEGRDFDCAIVPLETSKAERADVIDAQLLGEKFRKPFGTLPEKFNINGQFSSYGVIAGSLSTDLGDRLKPRLQAAIAPVPKNGHWLLNPSKATKVVSSWRPPSALNTLSTSFIIYNHTKKWQTSVQINGDLVGDGYALPYSPGTQGNSPIYLSDNSNTNKNILLRWTHQNVESNLGRVRWQQKTLILPPPVKGKTVLGIHFFDNEKVILEWVDWETQVSRYPLAKIDIGQENYEKNYCEEIDRMDMSFQTCLKKINELHGKTEGDSEQ
jgi:hypothetical protein